MTENMLMYDKKMLVRDKPLICSNCGSLNHSYKFCPDPITSWGIVLVRIETDNIDKIDNTAKICCSDLKANYGVHVENTKDLENICKYMNSIKFLLVRRKHSLGFIEFMRGRYAKDNIDGIIYLFQQMTPYEIKMIETTSFDELWNNFWPDNNTTDQKKQYFNKKEYTESKEKYDSLKDKNGVELSLDFYIKNVEPFFEFPEWSYAKGRKTRGESDLDCAVREFCEESGYKKTDIKIAMNVKPLVENIIGTNGVSYRHVYYLAEDISNNKPVIDEQNNTEIGAIGFFTYEEAVQMFRKYHVEKKNIAKNVFIYYLDMLINNPKDKYIHETCDDLSWVTSTDEF